MNAPEEPEEASFEVVDLFDGFVELEKRSATLSGSAPLRVAQACLPLLEGNAIGFQVVVRRETAIGSRIDGAVKFDDGVVSDLDRRLRAAIPMLSAQGVLDRAAIAELGSSVVLTPVGIGSRTITLFTGLLVRPRRGAILRVSGSGNRRSRDIHVKESFLTSHRFQPLFITMSIDKRATRITGELATLMALPERCDVTDVSGENARPLVEAHLAFYDKAYFDTKRAGQASRKYRSMIAKEPLAAVVPATADSRARLAHMGPAYVEQTPNLAGGPTRLVVRNAISFRARFDGLNVALQYDLGALDRFAQSIRSAWQPWVSSVRHPGALLYLTKYFTPHPPGEPHFFVKPPTLFATAPGWSTLLEGHVANDYDVLRGVVRTDSFHATPAVFQLPSYEEVRIDEGTPLMSLCPFPRQLEEAPFRTIPWSERGLS